MQRLTRPRRRGVPLTEEQREARHYARYGTTQLPARGTGLGTWNLRYRPRLTRMRR